MGNVNPFFVDISSSCFKIGLNTEKKLPSFSGSTLTICVGVGGLEDNWMVLCIKFKGGRVSIKCIKTINLMNSLDYWTIKDERRSG